MLLWCRYGVAVVVFVMLVVLLSRLCEDESLSRTQQARCAAVCCCMCVCNFFLWVMGDVYSRQVSYPVRVAPRLNETRIPGTETRVPGGGYPESSDPEWTRVRSRIPGYLEPEYPGTR